MIGKSAMFEPMLVACPGFVPTWRRFVDEWADESDGLPHYIALGDLARYLIGLVESGNLDGVRRAFEVVEYWLLEGDHYVREAATIGLLEDLQNDHLHTTTDPARLRVFLGPESLRWWNKVERFWSSGEIITDD